jgi:stage V sporulation protein AF
MEDIFQGNVRERDENISNLLHLDECFDIIRRSFRIGGRQAFFYSVDGFLKGDVTEKVMEFFYSIPPEDMPEDFGGFLQEKIPYLDLMKVKKQEDFVRAVLSGMSCLLVEGYDEILALDFRIYPSRSVEEPDKDKVLRGSRDGFIESLIPNIALVRRRIRDVNLIFSLENVGKSSKTDVALCYMKDRVDTSVLKKVQTSLKNMEVDSLTMNLESLAEALFPKGWLNPFPKFKFTERPDTAAACILEGSIVILCDNASAAMVIPSSLFEIIEDANDYYFPPVTGTYLRLSRMLVNIAAVFLTPVFVLLMQHPEWVPPALSFIEITDAVNIPPVLQLLILEVAIDGLRMAAVNTPNMLNTPLSIIAGIVFGDYTVQAGWFNSEVMLYMAFVAVANYSQSNMELGYALKFMRIQLLILTGLFGGWGFLAGCVILLLTLFCTRTVSGRNYLYPLYPFDGVQCLKRFFRVSLQTNENLRR